MLNLLMNSSFPYQATPFDQIQPELFEKAIDQALEISRERRLKIENQTQPDFKNVIEALELASLELDQVTTLFFNLYQACTNDFIDQAVASVSEKLSTHSNDTILSEKLFSQIKLVFEKSKNQNLKPEERKLLDETYQSFTRNGALLNDQAKIKLREIDTELSSLSPKYSQNLLKATNIFFLNITDERQLKSLPESVKEAAQQEARERKQQGWTFTLQAPSYIPFMKYMDQRELRKKMWMAYNSKALSGDFSNREICQQMARLRNKRASLLGYPTHAHFVLEKRMAKSPEQVFSFLEKLKAPSLTYAKKELAELQDFVKTVLKESIEIQAWDFSFYSEKLKKHLYDLNDEDLRPYFPLPQVVDGVLLHGQKLYGLEFKKRTDIPVYHPDVLVYSLHRKEEYVGILYLDLYPRDNKKSGAWMTNFKEQGFDGQSVGRPHVSIVCNFSKPTQDKPSLLTFNEVQTLFHEFGHALHSLSSHCYYRSLSGTNVLWDFVELPSQIMENWTYEKESLDLFAHHYKTQEKIPDTLVEKLRSSMNFQAGYGSLRQVQFSLVDLYWHTELDHKDLDPVQVEKEALKNLLLLPSIEGTNFSVGFSHVFAGGYSAGYYSYKWAEVLDADAFQAFLEEGLFNPTVASRFYDNILSKGGVEDPAVLYKRFRGRDPDPKALLRRSGLV